MPTPALNIGSAVHYAEACRALGSDPYNAVDIYYEDVVDQLAKRYEAVVGAPLSEQEWAILADEREMVQAMMRAYYARYGRENPTKPYQIIAPEITFRIPLVPDYDIYLIGTIDRAFIDPQGNPLPGEIKTYKTAPKKVDWTYNHQIYGYAAAMQVLTRQRVKYALYDGIRKKMPTMPRVLKDGTLSTAWIDTTYDVYRAKLLEVYGGDKSILHHPAYAEFMSRLKARDLSPDSAFHTRFRLPISQKAIEKWWDQAVTLACEMANYPAIYPNFPWDGCRFCRVRDLCHAIQSGDDKAEAQIRTEFAPGLTHTKQAKFVATPDTVKGIADLVAYAGSLDPDRPFDISIEAESEPA
jgi:hypothetical protein